MEVLIFGILWYVLSLNFKNLLFRILRKKPCSCQCLLLYLGAIFQVQAPRGLIFGGVI